MASDPGFNPFDPTATTIARALRAIRVANGKAERQGEEDMEDAMAIAHVLREDGAIADPGSRQAAKRRAA